MEYIELSPNLTMVEVTTPKSLVGKTLAETDLRAKYRVNVVAIKRGEEVIVPPVPSEKILDEDILFVVGETKGIHKLEELD
jgi:trk system potassium uptake protein TrkA